MVRISGGKKQGYLSPVVTMYDISCISHPDLPCMMQVDHILQWLQVSETIKRVEWQLIRIWKKPVVEIVVFWDETPCS
jgi:hypothetical protein